MIQATLYEEKKNGFLTKILHVPLLRMGSRSEIGSAFAKNKRLVFALDLQKKILRRSPFTELTMHFVQ